MTVTNPRLNWPAAAPSMLRSTAGSLRSTGSGWRPRHQPPHPPDHDQLTTQPQRQHPVPGGFAVPAGTGERHDLLVISDEVYEHLVFDNGSTIARCNSRAARAQLRRCSHSARLSASPAGKPATASRRPHSPRIAQGPPVRVLCRGDPGADGAGRFHAAKPDYPATLAAFTSANATCSAMRCRLHVSVLRPAPAPISSCWITARSARAADTQLCEHWTQTARYRLHTHFSFLQQPPATVLPALLLRQKRSGAAGGSGATMRDLSRHPDSSASWPGNSPLTTDTRSGRS